MSNAQAYISSDGDMNMTLLFLLLGCVKFLCSDYVQRGVVHPLPIFVLFLKMAALSKEQTDKSIELIKLNPSIFDKSLQNHKDAVFMHIE